MSSSLTSELIQQQALSLGFHKVGIARVQSDSTAVKERNAALDRWLAQGLHADMEWMTNPKRQDITKVMPDVRSVICVALNYYTPHQRPNDHHHGKIARYGWGRDYHRVMQKKLKALAEWLRSHDDSIQTRFYADTGPIQDKFWAQQAGLGWIAKNGNLITRDYGSWVFLGEILINIELTPNVPHTEHCGTCTRCLEACPTQAIVSPQVIDANRCIAYHTIENRANMLPPDIVDHLEGWVAGCDICQDVCPWNQRFATATDVVDFEPYPQNVAPTLDDLETITDADWNRRFPASALRRIKPEMWRRNAKAARQRLS
ncbi:tRNA epoxyqueuosine(34) reductase QueG [Oscillatoria sp. CS-180]|uniref:tRNA epoxyqueuosine(34) reductase QueG n=1 Tax=Oscillatoria sp. CS-180 TaxID=3021720 RepID=UPI00232E764E|nr:tRNA epoxyqueuosine(34) reductase QueG [Oscillatoria sp. CS-180]MDB9525802.1 tRNA epoxyqueuosine(34) reductase QueG [Oscillatoria sp. CS-180]